MKNLMIMLAIALCLSEAAYAQTNSGTTPVINGSGTYTPQMNPASGQANVIVGSGSNNAVNTNGTANTNTNTFRSNANVTTQNGVNSTNGINSTSTYNTTTNTTLTSDSLSHTGVIAPAQQGTSPVITTPGTINQQPSNIGSGYSTPGTTNNASGTTSTTQPVAPGK